MPRPAAAISPLGRYLTDPGAVAARVARVLLEAARHQGPVAGDVYKRQVPPGIVTPVYSNGSVIAAGLTTCATLGLAEHKQPGPVMRRQR